MNAGVETDFQGWVKKRKKNPYFFSRIFFFDFNIVFITLGSDYILFQSIQIGLVFGKDHPTANAIFRVGLIKLAFRANHCMLVEKVKGRTPLLVPRITPFSTKDYPLSPAGLKKELAFYKHLFYNGQYFKRFSRLENDRCIAKNGNVFD